MSDAMPQRSHAAGILAITRRVNGGARRVVVPPQTTSLDVRRERMRLTGTKKDCDRGECGAVGVGPAIANAIHHAAGIRRRDGPIRPERLIRAASRQE